MLASLGTGCCAAPTPTATARKSAPSAGAGRYGRVKTGFICWWYLFVFELNFTKVLFKKNNLYLLYITLKQIK